jgi:hypothetical protein
MRRREFTALQSAGLPGLDKGKKVTLDHRDGGTP